MLFYSSCELLSSTFLAKKKEKKTGGTPTKINFNKYLIGSNQSQREFQEDGHCNGKEVYWSEEAFGPVGLPPASRGRVPSVS